MFFFWCQHCYFLTLFRFTTCKKPPVLTPNIWYLMCVFCVFCGSSLVSLEVFPQHKSCWSCRQVLYVTIFFISPLFLCLFNLEFQKLLLSIHSVLPCSFLLSIFSILLFFTLLSIPCSVFSLCLFTLFSDLPYCFLFKSVILSFLFSFYSFLACVPFFLSLFSLSLYSLSVFLCFLFSFVSILSLFLFSSLLSYMLLLFLLFLLCSDLTIFLVYFYLFIYSLLLLFS